MEELDLRRMQEEMMNRNDPGPPRLKEKYECEQKFIVNLEFVKSNFHFSMPLGTNEKISDIIEKLRQRFNINSRILLLFRNAVLDPNLLIAESELYPFCTLKVIYLGKEK